MWYPRGCTEIPPDPTSTCIISLGWECDIKNGIVSDDVTRWSVDAGTWNATQSWMTGTRADILTTASSNALLTCDTRQSAPLDDRVRVKHWVKVTNANDEAVILLAGHKVVLKSGSVEIRSGATVLDSFTSFGIGMNVVSPVHVCTWHDDDVNRDYLGVTWSFVFSTYGIVAEVTLGTDGTTAFGTDSVTGAVSFHHVNVFNGYTPGEFAHNTLRVDGEDELNCETCHVVDCENCPGKEAPSYLTVSVDGLHGRVYGYTPYCDSCEDLNGSYVIDMNVYGWPSGCEGHTPSMKACVLDSVVTVTFTIAITVRITAITGGWRLDVIISEASLHGPHHHATQYAVYYKEYTDEEMCNQIDDDLTLDYYIPQGDLSGCSSLGELTIHVEAI